MIFLFKGKGVFVGNGALERASGVYGNNLDVRLVVSVPKKPGRDPQVQNTRLWPRLAGTLKTGYIDSSIYKITLILLYHINYVSFNNRYKEKAVTMSMLMQIFLIAQNKTHRIWILLGIIVNKMNIHCLTRFFSINALLVYYLWNYKNIKIT